MDPLLLCDATEADLSGILAIYNDVVETSTAIYSLSAVTLEDRRAWFEARQAGGFPILVAKQGSEILGYASFGEFRGLWSGYRHTVEHSVHVRRDCRGRGMGAHLLRALLDRAARMGKHVMVGAIDATNEVSLKMHERLGFEQVAHFREVGHKFGRWLDLVFVQRFIDAPGAPREP